MRYKRVSIAVLLAVIALLMSACASAPQYAIADREPVTATQPLALPGWPDGVLIVCPRGHWDPQANCPSGTEWIAYDSPGADTLHEYAIAADANTEIARLQVEQVEALDAEAAAVNDNAEQIENELAWADTARNTERIGWIITLAAVIALAL